MGKLAGSTRVIATANRAQPIASARLKFTLNSGKTKPKNYEGRWE